MLVLVDANIILELFLPKRSLKQQCRQVIEQMAAKKHDIATTMLSVHLAYYFGLKNGLSVAIITDMLSDFLILDLTTQDYKQALVLLKGRDFEDAMQLAVALRGGCDAIITLDRQFSKTYKDKIRFVVPE